MKNIIKTLGFVMFVSLFASCNKDYIIGGDPNPTNRVNMTTLEYLKSMPETEGAAYLFEQAGMTDLINSEVTVFAPGSWAINRYLRRKYNVDRVNTPEMDPYTIEDIPNLEDMQQMGMYVTKGLFTMDAIPEEGLFVKMENAADDADKMEAYLTVDVIEKDWTGDDEYSYWLETQPKLLHILFKRGANWEFNVEDRVGMKGPDGEQYYDAPECDHYYRMWISNVVTTTGVVNVLYAGELDYNSHYYYHTLFFFGRRAMEQQ